MLHISPLQTPLHQDGRARRYRSLGLLQLNFPDRAFQIPRKALWLRARGSGSVRIFARQEGIVYVTNALRT